jgi:hypothetical protein
VDDDPGRADTVTDPQRVGQRLHGLSSDLTVGGREVDQVDRMDRHRLDA